NSELSAELTGYFASFDLIISYLYDPDRIFERSLGRCGVKTLLCAPARIVEKNGHGAKQLARPVEELGISVADLTERIFLSVDDRLFAQQFLRNSSRPVVAIHPGSGSKEKNWPLENWIELVSSKGGLSNAKGGLGHMAKQPSLVVVSGEADEAQVAQLEHAW